MSGKLFAKIGDLWGNPFHGLVVGSSLTLPNSATKTWAQPVGGDCDVVRAPGQPAVSRTPAQLAEDATAGFQWRNYSLISGSARQFYGRDLGGSAWIYVPSPGNAFVIKHTGTTTCKGDAGGGEVAASFTVEPLYFGAGAATEDASTKTASLDPIGQGQYNNADITLYLQLATTSESGAKALFKVFKGDGAIFGWLMATVSGTTESGISIAWSSWKDRDATFSGTVHSVQNMSATNCGEVWPVSVTSCCINPQGYIITYGVTGNTGANPQTYSGVESYEHDDEEIFTYLLNAGFNGETPYPVEAVISKTLNQTSYSGLAIIEDTSIPDEASYPGCGGPAGGQWATWDVTVTGTLYTETKLEIRVNGSAVKTAKVVRDFSGEVIYHLGAGGDQISSYENDSTDSLTFTDWDGTDHVLYSGASDLVPTQFYLPQVNHDNSASYDTVELVADYLGYFMSATPVASSAPVYVSHGGDTYAATYRPVGYKAGICVHDLDGTASVAAVITPYGLKSGTVSLSSYAAQSGVKVSHQPITDALSIHASTARCWV